jgi:lipid-A-disaccharide synthase
LSAPREALRIAVIAGEESGDLLGADLVGALQRLSGRPVELIGVGGRHLASAGLKSLFDPAEIALMGFSAVIGSLPRLLRRIGQAARAVVAARPDCLITIDTPAFGLRVARKVRAAAPEIPIIHYVCPSVWAWAPRRAPAMKPYVDHILCLLPFEPEALQRLGGPPGTFVGHRLTHEPGLAAARAAQSSRPHSRADETRTLLILPGSRRGEVKRLIEPFGATVEELGRRGNRLRVVLPTVPHVEGMVEAATASWSQRPEIVTDADAKWRAFAEADAALCASGTVSLELAIAGVPLVSCYRLDPIARSFSFLVTTWSGSLPNLIADRPVVPEFYEHFVRPQHLARYLEVLLADTEVRRWQRSGFDEVRRRLATDRPSGEIAAEVVLQRLAIGT